MGRKDSGLRRAFFRHAASSASSNRSSSFLYALIGRITETGLPARVMISGSFTSLPMRKRVAVQNRLATPILAPHPRARPSACQGLDAGPDAWGVLQLDAAQFVLTLH